MEVRAKPKVYNPLEQQQPITISLYTLIALSLYALVNLSDCVPASLLACLYVLFKQFIRPKIVLTANKVRSFFHADNQMAIPVATIMQLVQ